MTWTIGARGSKVRQLQEQLNRIADNYPALPKSRQMGSMETAQKMRSGDFQGVFGLPQTGITDYRTWYKIQEIYVAVSRIAELN